MLSEEEITKLLIDWSGGDSQALEKLMPLVLEDLRKLARKHFGREAPGHTLQPTALINEVYLKLIGRRSVQWANRAQFFGFASELMRRVLVDHARARETDKRGKGIPKVSLDELAAELTLKDDLDLLALDEALSDLAKLNQRQAHIVRLRFFGGLTVEEISEFLEISPRTVKRDWRIARMWLFKNLRR